jgi:hypothetical protein
MRRLDDRKVLSFTLAIGAGGALLFRWLFELDARWVPHSFYLWTGGIASVGVAQFWRVNSEIFTVASAKRFFAPIGAGGALGAIVGAALAELAQRWVAPRDLLVLGAANLALVAVVPPLLLPAPELRRPPPRRRRDPVVRADTRLHLVHLLVAVALTALTATLVDYTFKSTVDDEIAPAALGVFFSRFYLGLNLVSLLIQALVAPFLLRTLGVTRVLFILPLTLALGAAGAVLFGGIAAVVLLRGADGGLRQSLHRSAIELLYFPLSKEQRKRYKAVIDSVGQRIGQALGSLLILAAMAAGLALPQLAIIVGGLTVAWAFLVVPLRRGYLDLFRHNLRAGVLETGTNGLPLDLWSLETLVASLNSEHDEEVLSALDLLAAHDKRHVVPALLLYHPSRAVVLRVLEILGDESRPDVVAIAGRLTEHADPEIRAAATSAVARTMPRAELVHRLKEERPGIARDAVLVALVARGLDEGGAARRQIDARAQAGSAPERAALARAIRHDRASLLRPVLHAMAGSAVGELRRELARAFGALRDESALSLLVHWVGPRDARTEARRSLVALGSEGLAAASQALADPSRSRQLRAHLPTTIAHFDEPRSADALLDVLEAEPDGWVRYKILRALRRLSGAHPELRIDPDRLARLARGSLVRACDLLASRLALRELRVSDPGTRSVRGELLGPILAEKEAQAIDRAVRLIALAHPRDVMNGIVHAVRSPDRRLRAESRELLSNVAEPALGRALVAMLDEDTPERTRLTTARTALTTETPAVPTYEAVVRELIGDESDAVRAIAAYHAAELGLTSLLDSLAQAAERASEASRPVIEHAIAQLARPRDHG